MAGPSDDVTRVVSLFPDHAGTVIWLSEPLPYEVTGLSRDLIGDLRAWEQSYETGLDADYEWRSAELRDAFAATGKRLARRLAGELGDEFAVEYDVAGPDRKRRVRGAGPPRNPIAAAAFRQLAAILRADRSRMQEVIAQARREGHALEWRAY